MNYVVSHLDEVRAGVKKEAEKIGEKAKANLAAARASTTHTKISGPSHITAISVTEDEVDSLVNMDGEDPMAIEFGHAPSGYFAPGSYGKVTKAPHGLYILTRAAGAGDVELTPAPTRQIGKR